MHMHKYEVFWERRETISIVRGASWEWAVWNTVPLLVHFAHCDCELR